MFRRSAVLVLAALAAAPLVDAQHELAPFVVGVWSYDSLIPFADFDGKRWRGSWPEPLDTSDSGPQVTPTIPRLSRIPSTWWGSSQFEPTWELVERGGQRRAIQITGTTLASYGSSCTANVGLQTNLPDEAYSHHLLATNAPGVIQQVRELKPGAGDWRTISGVLPDLYRRYDSPVQPILNDVRPDLTALKASPSLEVAFMSSHSSGQFAYFQSRRVRMDRPGDSSLAGWLWRRSPTSPWQAVTAQIVARNDDYGIGTFTPLGFVSEGSLLFWLGIESNSLAIIDVRRAGVRTVLSIGMGLC
jgi:hypothetical protein